LYDICYSSHLEFNPLNPEVNKHLRNQLQPEKLCCVSITKTNQLMPCREIIALQSENSMEHTNPLYLGEFLNAKAGDA
jgi:hypothetical protein